MEEVNKIAKQVHEIYVNWRPDIFINVDEVIKKEEFKRAIENKEIYIIRKENIIIGYVKISIKEKIAHGINNRKVIHIESICVDEKYRGQGAGTKLINYVINLGKKQNFNDIQLTVNEENTGAIKLYEKLGMKVKNISYSMKI